MHESVSYTLLHLNQGIMKKFILFWILVCDLLIGAPFIQHQEIPTIMGKLFTYHVESKSLTPHVIRRCFKIYIEQFDPDKIYLLEEEVRPFISMGPLRAREIGNRMKKGNYQDFYALDKVIKIAIKRSRNTRTKVFASFQGSPASLSIKPNSSYATSKEELHDRIEKKLNLFYLYHKAGYKDWDQKKTDKLFSLFENKLRRGENNFLDLQSNKEPLSESEKEHNKSLRILKAFAKSLDAHTTFFSEEEAKQMRLALEKQFEGFGVVLSEGLDGVYISDVIKGSPADLSKKVYPNDKIISIDGKSVENLPFDAVLQTMKNKKEKTIVLGLQNHAEHWKVKLRKAPIVMEDERLQYSYEDFGNGIIGKITLNSFYESSNGITSEKDLRRAILNLKKKKPLKGIVLDFRENSGGFLSQAVKVASLFISSGIVVVSKYGKKDVHYLRTVDTNSLFNGPIIILTSKMSASAAEIVAQALQDYGSALILGDERTFGKGSIQYQTVTDSRADYFFKVTVGRYYTVSGKSTQIDGVKPDIHFPSHYAPFQIGERYLENPLPPDRMEPMYKDRLSDLNARTKKWFEKNYLPHLQKRIVFWKKMLPTLLKNSKKRLNRNAKFQKYIQLQKELKKKIANKEPIHVSPFNNYGFEDLHFQEALFIMQDMIMLEAKSRKEVGLPYTEDGKDPLSLKAS